MRLARRWLTEPALRRGANHKPGGRSRVATALRETSAPVQRCRCAWHWKVRGAALVLATGLGCGEPATALANSTSAATACTALAVAPHSLTPIIQSPNPRPGEALSPASPRAYVAAHITANVAIRRIELRLDGRVVDPAIAGRDESDVSLFYQPRHRTPGAHGVVVIVWDVAGAAACRAWSVRILTPRPHS